MKLPSSFNSVYYNFRSIYSQDICGVLHDISNNNNNNKKAIKNQVKSQKVLRFPLYYHYWVIHHYLMTSWIRSYAWFFFFFSVLIFHELMHFWTFIFLSFGKNSFHYMSSITLKVLPWACRFCLAISPLGKLGVPEFSTSKIGKKIFAM